MRSLILVRPGSRPPAGRVEAGSVVGDLEEQPSLLLPDLDRDACAVCVLGSVLKRLEAAEIDGCLDLGRIPTEHVGLDTGPPAATDNELDHHHSRRGRRPARGGVGRMMFGSDPAIDARSGALGARLQAVFPLRAGTAPPPLQRPEDEEEPEQAQRVQPIIASPPAALFVSLLDMRRLRLRLVDLLDRLGGSLVDARRPAGARADLQTASWILNPRRDSADV
jgi:hypothetical protein